MSELTMGGNGEKRWAMVELLPECLVQILSGDSFAAIDNCIPADGRVVRAGYDHVTDMFYLIVESREYDLIPGGAEIPRAAVTVLRREKSKATG